MATATQSQRLLAWCERHPYLALTILTLLALAPFLDKPVSMDDPLFIWAARHIQVQPANPYNFEVNWYGFAQPMARATQNPPLTSYFMALAAAVIGWSEIALHTAFLLPALAVILGTYRLARQFCERPLFAATITLFTPVFLVSSTTLMCDVPMLAFWMWAIVLWIEGLERSSLPRLIGSTILILLAACTKYFGIALIPLFAAYAFSKQKRLGGWAVCLLIPVAGLIAYQWQTAHLYGFGLLSDAGGFSLQNKMFATSPGTSALITFAFTGGCAAIAVFLAPWLWPKRTLLILSAITVIASGLIIAFSAMWRQYQDLPGTSHFQLAVQIIFWALGGVSILGLAFVELWQRRDPASWLLALWIAGTFIFTAFINYMVNGRSLLPLAPAAAILATRRLFKNGTVKNLTPAFWTAAGAGALLTALITRADFQFARAVQQNALATAVKYGHGPGTLWFEGHWGWQYYMEQQGAKAITVKDPLPPPDDVLALVSNNTNLQPPNHNLAHLADIVSTDDPHLVSTVSSSIGAGFYSSVWGPLPFAIGLVPQEQAYIFVIGPPSKDNSPGAGASSQK